jgi:hypothetical protein
MRTIDDILRPFFATWTTSLMGFDLAQLKSLSMDDRLSRLVNTLVIEDDCTKLDPWTIGGIPKVDSSHHTWPRTKTGIVVEGELDVGISDLVCILRERLLRPTKIRIRDYRIADDNFRLYPEMAHVRELIHVTSRNTSTAVSVSALAKSVVDGSSLGLTCLKFRGVDLPHPDLPILKGDTSRFCKNGENGVIGGPKVEEVIIKVFKEYEGQETSFSMLHSADTLVEHDTAPYWLEQIFYKAKTLKTLSLTVKQPPGRWLTTDRVIPMLREFVLSHTTVSVDDLLAMIASSKESLTHIHLRQVSLTGNSTWRNVLSLIAKEYRKLTSFNLALLREIGIESLNVDFSDAKAHIPDEYCPGLKLIEKGKIPYNRVMSLSYNGLSGGLVLDILASHMKAETLRAYTLHPSNRVE